MSLRSWIFKFLIFSIPSIQISCNKKKKDIMKTITTVDWKKQEKAIVLANTIVRITPRKPTKAIRKSKNFLSNTWRSRAKDFAISRASLKCLLALSLIFESSLIFFHTLKQMGLFRQITTAMWLLNLR